VSRDVRVFRTTGACNRAAAEFVVAAIGSAVATRGVCFLGLSGGATPEQVYRMLAEPPISGKIDWSRVHVFFVDERPVPPDDPQSNYGMIHAALLSRIPLPPDHIHRIRGEHHPVVAAGEYLHEIAAVVPGKPPCFDLILLGVGEDGHTASLFPGTDVVLETTVPVRAAFVSRMSSWRVTMTRACLDNARKVLFLVTGPAKAEILRTILVSPPPGPGFPAFLITPLNGDVVWMLDADAAALIDPGTTYGS
jgi:6-phosphogluconolactonase